MKKKKWLIGILTPAVIAAAALGLWQLGRSMLHTCIARETPPTVPARLVSRIDVADYPVNQETARSYTDQDDVTRLLHLLRAAPLEMAETQVPALEDAAYFTCVTLGYANGNKEIWYLLEDRFIRSDDESWYQADPLVVAQLQDFLESHPGGDDPATESTAPSA